MIDSMKNISKSRVFLHPFHRVLIFAVLACLGLVMSGCRYAHNRLYDFCDIFQAGVGVTSQNPDSGMVPPAIGVHVQASEFMNLGAVYFNGSTAEMDGRGFFAGPESRQRYGLLCFQRLKIDQSYTSGSMNYFKQSQSQWTKRMNSRAMRWSEAPAKELDYDYWAEDIHEGYPILYRGWQYWENIGVEFALSEPFLTHLGFDVRFGIDPSEVSDFVLGFFGVDFQSDDLTEDEYEEMVGPQYLRGKEGFVVGRLRVKLDENTGKDLEPLNSMGVEIACVRNGEMTIIQTATDINGFFAIPDQSMDAIYYPYSFSIAGKITRLPIPAPKGPNSKAVALYTLFSSTREFSPAIIDCGDTLVHVKSSDGKGKLTIERRYDNAGYTLDADAKELILPIKESCGYPGLTYFSLYGSSGIRSTARKAAEEALSKIQ
ncbi:MAG: hypothetical protein NTX50_31185 [Candidatus Sumerlaeota bacterium]|nr:hypothetical protein [Candidatus Sumerlaeota bacterium]